MAALWIAFPMAAEAQMEFSLDEVEEEESKPAKQESQGDLIEELAAAEAGATAVIQPGGSMRDDAVIEAADEAGLAMVFTGMRHFRH